MKNLTLITAITINFLLLTNNLTSQPCLPEGITFTTQVEIDSFQINYPNCIEIEGDVEINGLDITNLIGLNPVTFIGGSLNIGTYNGGTTSLSNLTGLESLISIGGDFYIMNNDFLNTLTGINNLTTIGGTLRMRNNSSLTSLTSLENLSYIGGNLRIALMNISSLSGLENLSHIGGSISIFFVSGLTNLTGLENLSYIGGGIGIHGADNMTNLIGLENVTSIHGTLNIAANYDLVNLTGLENLTSIGGDLYVEHNISLTSLTGLENVASIGGYLEINNNNNLISLTGLENVSYLTGDLRILSNDDLTSLAGLDNIEGNSIENLSIRHNQNLSACEVQSVCDYLINSGGGDVFIDENAPGCNSIEEIKDACDLCLPEGIIFTNQAEIDSFQTNYPNCSEIEGDVNISGQDINNLNSLIVLTAIEGNLTIGQNPMLTTLTGLDNLTSISGSLLIVQTDTLYSLTGLEGLTEIEGVFHVEGNDRLHDFNGLNNITTIGSSFNVDLNWQLVDFHGLENLTSVGDDFLIGGLNIAFWIGNQSLVNLSGLENLTSIGGRLTIAGNDNLSNLIALDNLNYIGENLSVFWNSSLAECNIQSICEYLASPNGLINIYDNAPGCNSPEEVEEACPQSVDEVSVVSNLSISPNPFTDIVSIEFELKQPEIITISIYNHLGEMIEVIVERKSVGQQKIEWNCKGLPAGIYFCVLKTNNGIQTIKMIKL